MIRGAILASGRGSNAANLVNFSREASCENELEIACLIVDNPQALVLERARKWDLPHYCVPGKGVDRDEREKKMLEILRHHGVEWVFLAGYKRILSKNFLSAFPGSQSNHSKVVNIHPSLLPDFPGLKAYERAFEAGVEFSGVTIHFVDEGVDTGPVICQESFPRKENDTLEDFVRRGLELEHRLYRKAVGMIIGGQYHAH